MHTPDPEHAVGSETKVEITNLDLPGKPLLGRPARWSRAFPFRTHPWVRIGIVAAIVIIVILILVSMSQTQKGTRVAKTPLPTFYPLSLSVVNGICYASSTSGTVLAVRVSDGSLLWRHEGGKAGEESPTVVDGIVYLVPFSSGASIVTVEALHANNGSLLWSRTLPTDSSVPVQPTIMHGIVYVSSKMGEIDALRASNGSLLWHYTSPTPFLSASSEADSIVYVGTQDGHLSALRASDGTVLWRYSPPIPFNSIVAANGIVLLTLRDGGMDVVRANSGVVLWHYTVHVPTQRLLLPLLVANGVIYAMTQDGYLSAFRASNGVSLWHVALHTPDISSLMDETTGAIYVGMPDGSIVAIEASNGSVLWRYQNGGGPALAIAAQGLIYLAFYTSGLNTIGRIVVLRATDGVVLWNYTPHVPAKQILPVMAGGLVLIALSDGSIHVVDAGSGVPRWQRAFAS